MIVYWDAAYSVQNGGWGVGWREGRSTAFGGWDSGERILRVNGSSEVGSYK